MASEAESPLSSVPSEDEMADEATSTPARSRRPSVDDTTHERDTPSSSQPPSKKRKTGPGGFHHWHANANDGAAGGGGGGGGASTTATAAAPGEQQAAATAEQQQQNEAPDVDLSEDSEGSAPGTPSLDEHALRADQVTACQWESCPVGDLGNSDDLIKHVQDDHISPKRAKYTCEWGECARKGAVHPSGYALKAHMRSHTKEKPFFCALPECDRSFTRSDALAKHMRTVHEPEPAKQTAAAAAAAADSTANSTPSTTRKKGPPIRVNKLSAATTAANAAAAAAAEANPLSLLDPKDPNYDPSPANDNIQYIPARHPITGQPGFMITYPPDIHFSQFESEIPANQLVRLLRRQLHWAQGETAELKAELEELERLRRDEWRMKEALLQGVMGTELRLALEDGLVQEGLLRESMEADAVDGKNLSWTGAPVWKKRSLVRRVDVEAQAQAQAEAEAEDEEDEEEEEDNGGAAAAAAAAAVPAAKAKAKAKAATAARRGKGGRGGAASLARHMEVDRDGPESERAPSPRRDEEEEEDGGGGGGSEDDEVEDTFVGRGGHDGGDDEGDDEEADEADEMEGVRQSGAAAAAVAAADADANVAAAATQADVERDAIDALMGMGGGRAG